MCLTIQNQKVDFLDEIIFTWNIDSGEKGNYEFSGFAVDNEGEEKIPCG